MNPTRSRFAQLSSAQLAATLLAATLLASPALVAQGDRQGDGLSREQMWRAPTAEDWAKPVLIPFQRTWQDALAVARETGKPILICVNMDGEIASEHYAGIRYRSPEVAALYEPYVCVIASVYRHNPSDFDEAGNRVDCPRFGCVTCGEHIALEPLLYEKYFDGVRVAPRHIMIELGEDGQPIEESYDIYYAFDTATVFDQVKDGIAQRGGPTDPVVRGDRTILERVQSRDQADRDAVEGAYRDGDRDMKKALLEEAAKHPDAAPAGLLRLAVFGLDQEMADMARQTLAKVEDPAAVDLIAQALKAPLPEAEREALTANLERIGATDPKARKLASVERGLTGSSKAVDTKQWSTAVGAQSYASAAAAAGLGSTRWAQVGEQLSDAERALAAGEMTAEERRAAWVEKVEGALALARHPERNQQLPDSGRLRSAYVRLLFEDALRSAEAAREAGVDDWRVDAAEALARYDMAGMPASGRDAAGTEKAYALAERAVAAMPAGATGPHVSSVLELFAYGRMQAISDAVRNRQKWPGTWLADINAAYDVLAEHPDGNAAQVITHYDFVQALGGERKAFGILSRGLDRFPVDPGLHQRLREAVIRARGPDGLRDTYASLMAEENAHIHMPWFAGMAEVRIAEGARRRGRRGEAIDAYGRAVALFDQSSQADPGVSASADRQAAMALAGRGRAQAEMGEWGAATESVLASLARDREVANTPDGINTYAVGTIKLILAALAEAEGADPELAPKLQKALAELPPELKSLPAFERGRVPPGGQGRRWRRNR